MKREHFKTSKHPHYHHFRLQQLPSLPTVAEAEEPSVRKDSKTGKMNGCLNETAVFKPSKPIFVLLVVRNFKISSDSSGIHDRALKWLSSHIVKEPAKAFFWHRIYALEDCGKQYNGNLSTNCQAVNYRLEIHATDDVITEREVDITNYKQPDHMGTVMHSGNVCEN